MEFSEFLEKFGGTAATFSEVQFMRYFSEVPWHFRDFLAKFADCPSQNARGNCPSQNERVKLLGIGVLALALGF